MAVSPSTVTLSFVHLYLSGGISTTKTKGLQSNIRWDAPKSLCSKLGLPFWHLYKNSSQYICLAKLLYQLHKLSFVNLSRYSPLFNIFSVMLKVLSCLKAILSKQILKCPIFLLSFSVKLSFSTVYPFLLYFSP